MHFRVTANGLPVAIPVCVAWVVIGLMRYGLPDTLSTRVRLCASLCSTTDRARFLVYVSRLASNIDYCHPAHLFLLI